MKKLIRVFALFLGAAMLMAAASCGQDMSRYNGDWTLSSIDGAAPEEYAEDNNLYTYSVYFNFSFNDSIMTSTRLNESGTPVNTEYKATRTENGVKISSGKTAAELPYDENADTLTFRVQNEEGVYKTYLLVRGKTDLEALYAAGN